MVSSSSRKTIVEAARNAKIIGVRAGTEHRYTGVWVVVIEDRIFARSWNDKPTGWFRAFRKEPRGTIQIDELEIPVRAKAVRSARLRDAVTARSQRNTTRRARGRGLRASRNRSGS